MKQKSQEKLEHVYFLRQKIMARGPREQSKIAKEAHVNKATINRIMNQERDIEGKNLWKLLKMFNAIKEAEIGFTPESAQKYYFLENCVKEINNAAKNGINEGGVLKILINLLDSEVIKLESALKNKANPK